MAAKKKSGLGRGIGALIPQQDPNEERPVDVFFGDAPAKEDKATSVAQTVVDEQQLREVPGAQLTTLDLSDIVPNRVQPRTEFDEEALEELTHSIREFGVFQPVVVREILPAPTKKGEPRYELIMGERRFRASNRAGLSTIPAIVRGTEDEHMLRDALLENLHRAQLNPLEEASAYQQLLQDFGTTQEELAKRIGRSRPQISNTIRLLKLPEHVQTKVAAGVLTAGHARAILSLDGDAEAMEKLSDKIINEGLSVRQAEEASSQATKRKLPKPRAGGVQAQLDDIAERLGDRFNTTVRVKLGAKKGQVTIDFATIADLKRILDELGDPGFQ
ncbi:ParB/RepB/Spo0J family partition protein [Leucobacter sp. UCMA 4100]|uniref:ParB/RepB/Spo0J family partition protein n=1 Tax=Leucobacter sp. UCMA 4100 TaxID=2810534 RepID=UPI0022EA5AA7|nr:ParB/RepB/Spo0J family partition protein [Leucobacter sp. UCMA 4100]MDA3147048.1 ParB/RepB/Spo0J family partition protein [Leucobacter sp. UCMA 4100]